MSDKPKDKQDRYEPLTEAELQAIIASPSVGKEFVGDRVHAIPSPREQRLIATIRALQAEKATLQEWYERYGFHRFDCAYLQDGGVSDCSCGYRATQEHDSPALPKED